jgi:hypothetical protein
MGYMLTILVVLLVLLLIHFRHDAIKPNKSILKDRFFFTLIATPLALSIFLSIPIWHSSNFCMSSGCYENFLTYFKLPIIFIGLSSTIAAVYGFIHTSKQRECELESIRLKYEIDKWTVELNNQLAYTNSASVISMSLFRFSNNAYHLAQKLLRKKPGSELTIKEDHEIITKSWTAFYSDSRYMPAIADHYKHLDKLDSGVKGLSSAALLHLENINNTSANHHKFLREESFAELNDNIKIFEAEIVSYNKSKCESCKDIITYRNKLHEKLNAINPLEKIAIENAPMVETTKIEQAEISNGKYKFIGGIATLVWIIFLLAIFIPDYENFNNLELNEKGDFLAGAFAPIAFLWLVIGYLQQSQELRQNTTALTMQLVELKQQVENTKELASHAGEQANEAKRNTNNNMLQAWHNNYIALINEGPRINFNSHSVLANSYLFEFQLHTIQASEVAVSSSSGLIANQNFPIWGIGEKKNIEITPSNRDGLLISFVINYNTPFGLIGEASYTFNRTTNSMTYNGILLIDPPKPVV